MRPEWYEAQAEFRFPFCGEVDYLAGQSPEALAQRFARGDRHLRDAGVYYRQFAEGGSTERNWPLSHVPVMISADEWKALSEGIAQRADLLERVMADLYGPGDLVRRGLLPAQLVAQCSEWLRQMVGVQPRSGHHRHFLAFEIGRSPDGCRFVPGNRTQAPSAAGFALENRGATTRRSPTINPRRTWNGWRGSSAASATR